MPSDPTLAAAIQALEDAEIAGHDMSDPAEVAATVLRAVRPMIEAQADAERRSNTARGLRQWADILDPPKEPAP